MPDLPHIPDRYELKYVVPEWRLPEVREAIRPFCVLDPYAAARGERSYVIDSLYLDTPARALYRAVRERRGDRFKARIRTYAAAGAPVFLEVKHNLRGVVRKTRAFVPAGACAARLAAPLAPDADPAERAFRDRVDAHGLAPTLLVRYEREAWFSTIDAYARVTFDRGLVCRPWSRWEFPAGAEACASRWRPIDDAGTLDGVRRAVVVELKCGIDVPRWMTAVAQRLGLRRVGVSKYCNGVERIWGPGALPRPRVAWGP